MAEPGWIPPYIKEAPGDECMRLAFSCVTGIHPRRLRYICSENEKFWKEWRLLALQHGHKLRRVFNAEYDPLHGVSGAAVAPCGPWPFADDELWIAGVPSFLNPGGAHAVVMLGQQLHYDCSDAPRKRRPTRIESGWRVTKHG